MSLSMNAGNGLPIVLLPGLNGTARLLEDVRARLAEKRPASIVAYPTDRPLGYADLFQYVFERLPPGRFIVLGESFSGPIAIEIASRLREQTAGLVLAASFARRPIPFGGTFAQAWLSMHLPRPRWAMAGALMGRDATPALKEALAETLATVTNEVVAFRVGEATRVDRLTSLREVACPVLYLRGRRDWLLGDAPAQEVMRTARRCEVREIDGPHMLLATHPAEASNAIEAFCTALT